MCKETEIDRVITAHELKIAVDPSYLITSILDYAQAMFGKHYQTTIWSDPISGHLHIHCQKAGL
jgi:hypothetical protein